MPFTCQHCGGKFCEEHRLPPNHDCVNIGSWNAKPRPSISLNYGKGGGVTVTGGGYLPDRRTAEKKAGTGGLPWLKIMAVIVVLILLGFAWLVMSRYRFV
jgi:AN1-like Zinc finger